MAVAETARLISSLELQDKGFSRGIDKAIGGIDKINRRLGAVSGFVNRNLGRALDTAFSRASQFVIRSVSTGLEDLATLEDAITQVDGSIRQLGLGGKISGEQIAKWANEIESAAQAAFDDKDITSATTNLIRYGKVAPENLRQAMEVMTDLAARTGNVDTASQALAKALVDPANAAGKLARAGVVLNAEQQKQLLALTQLTDKQKENFRELAREDPKAAKRYKAQILAGRQTKAQAYLLDQLEKSTKGAAAASRGPYRDALNLLKDTFEDGRKALAEGFMPLIQRFAGEATEFFGKQSTIDSIRNFGQWLADAAESGLEMAKRIPWGTIGDGLKMAADWAGKLFAVFQSIPPEVQTTLIALAGLDKLSGGAISGIVSELGKGLIRGVLGITAGVVNLRAATVTGAGGGVVPSGGGKTGAGRVGSALSTVGKVLLVGIAAEAAIQLASAFGEQSGQIREQGQRVVQTTERNIGSMSADELRSAIANIDLNVTNNLGNQIALAITNPFNHAADNIQATYDLLKAELGKREQESGERERAVEFRADERRSAEQTKATREVKAEQTKAIIRLASSERTAATGLGNTSRAAQVAGVVGATATAIGAGRVVGAIERKDMAPDVFVTTTVNVTPGSIQRSTTTETSYGRTNGSSGGGRNERRPD